LKRVMSCAVTLAILPTIGGVVNYDNSSVTGPCLRPQSSNVHMVCDLD
jgi:hypothetical protein